MNKDIELAIESIDGIIDCRLEPLENEDGQLYYSATILYPDMMSGFFRSEIFCCDVVKERNGSGFVFAAPDDMHPKILKLETELSNAIVAANQR